MSRRYESNPTLIRPSPELFESTMRSIRSMVDKASKDAWYLPLSSTKPFPDAVRNRNGMLRKLSVDSTVGDGLSIHPHGSWFEVSVGVRFTPKAAVASIEEWARGRYGSSRAKEIEGHANVMFGMILANSTVRVVSEQDPPPPILATDYAGNSIRFITDIIARRESSMSAFVTSNKSALVIVVPDRWTIQDLKDSWPHVEEVVQHELTHMIDPGLGRKKYIGSPDVTIKRYGYDSRKQAISDLRQAKASRDKDLFLRARTALDESYKDYAGDPMEIRAEASRILKGTRRRIMTDWMNEHHRPMPSSLLWDFIVESENASGDPDRILSLRDKDQNRLLAYVAQALIEEGLVV